MMNIITTNEAPSRLYALQLKLRPLDNGTLMPFSGELVHGAWLRWIRNYAPEVAAWLHDGNKRRLFTCSSLQFPLPTWRMREAERENTHMPVDPSKTYLIRITLLLGELFPLFYKSLVQFNNGNSTISQVPFIQLGKRTFLLEEVILDNDGTNNWTSFTSFAELVETVQNKSQKRQDLFTLAFASLTTSNRSRLSQGKQSSYYARLPLPHYIFPFLAKRWQEFAPADLSNLIEPELIENYLQDEALVIDDYDLKAHTVRFVTHLQPGFIGSCTYRFRNTDTRSSSPLSIEQQIVLLARLAFYTGVGYKTAMGMGQCRFIEGRG